MKTINWPENKDFVFTVIDDTDNATVRNIQLVYDYLYKKGMLTTKSVWVYRPRDRFRGESLSDEKYCSYIKNLMEKGYEIAFHNVASGSFTRNET